MYVERSMVGLFPLQDEAFINGPLRLRGLPPQAQVLQRVMEMFVNLLCLFTGLKIGEVFSDLLDKLVQNLNRDRIVLLFIKVDVSVQNLYKKLHL